MASYEAETFPVGAFQCNCTVFWNPLNKDAMIVDPGDEAELILERIEAHDLRVRALWHTHAHIDHVGATMFLFDLMSRKNLELGLPAPKVYLHEGDRWLYEHIEVQAGMLGLPPFEVTKSFDGIVHGQKYEGFDKVKAIHTPGHTPGSCCLSIGGAVEIEASRSLMSGFDYESPRLLLSGDTLFRRSVGRTDLWGGDSKLIASSIRGQLYGLPPETVVVPGHGPLTSIEEERAKNPFVLAKV